MKYFIFNKMKTIIKINTLACILIILYACKEDGRGQYPIHGGAPAKVSSARVDENFAGGALIVYDIPQDEDALYVKACYQLDDGTQMELKSSIYTNNITIVGIGRSREVPVVLTVVDRSQNESEPVTVIAYPLDSPIYAIAEILDVKEDFGGISLRWQNPSELPVIIDVYKIEGNNDKSQVERFYSSTINGRANVRGQDTIETTFAIAIADRWGNCTDLISRNFKPLYEEKFDKSQFRRWNPPGLPYNNQEASAIYQIEALWDDIWYVGGPTLFPGTLWAALNGYFTFDMGQVGKISRFKLHQRAEATLIYNMVSPKRFQLWGSLTPDVSNDFATWQFIGSFESIKPSGLPLGQYTDEDVRYACIDGEDFEVEDCPYVRYLYFYQVESWGNDPRVQYHEMTLWGQIQK